MEFSESKVSKICQKLVFLDHNDFFPPLLWHVINHESCWWQYLSMYMFCVAFGVNWSVNTFIMTKKLAINWPNLENFHLYSIKKKKRLFRSSFDSKNVNNFIYTINTYLIEKTRKAMIDWLRMYLWYLNFNNWLWLLLIGMSVVIKVCILCGGMWNYFIQIYNYDSELRGQVWRCCAKKNFQFVLKNWIEWPGNVLFPSKIVPRNC